jgi:hypothetical protein
MTIDLNGLSFVLGSVSIIIGGYMIYIRHRIAKRKKRQREFLARGEG